MNYPWCPNGCQRTMMLHEFTKKIVVQGYDIYKQGEHDVKCPVCDKPIHISTELVPDYNCEKGEGWKD